MTAPATRAGTAAMRAQLAAAGAAIAIERAMPRELGTLLTLWGVYVAAALFGLADWMPGEARLGLFALLIVVSVALALRAAWRLGPPSLAARRARLERGGGLRRGQLALVTDQPVGDPDALAQLLWARALADTSAARPRLGRSEWQPSPPTRHGLLPLLALALALGLLLAKADAPRRVADAFSPYATSLAAVRVHVNVEAPDYAGALPRRLVVKGGDERSIEALAGSRIGIRVEGIAGTWSVRAPGGSETWSMNGAARLALDRGGTYRVKLGGRTVAALDVSLAADGIPVIRFDGVPARTPTGALRIGYRLADDHGAAALSLLLQRGGDSQRVDLETSAASGRGHVFADLTPHPFAGATVDIMLMATDGAGQSGVSPPIRVALPERSFVHPVAQRIIAIRNGLLAGGARLPAMRALGALAVDPKSYGDDYAVFAGLRGAGWRLLHDRRPSARESVAALLWDIAVDLEDGGASRAMDDLRAAMERLSKGLEDGDDEALAAMAEELEKAMSDYLRRQIEAALAEGGQPPSATGAGVSVDLDFLDQMFADLKDRLAAGDAAGAAKALANLRQLMETIRFGNAAPDPEAQKRAAAAAEIARQLRDIEARQGALRDKTIADMIRASFGGDDALKGSAATQAELRTSTERLDRQFGAAGAEAPPELGAAKDAMAEAARALSRGDAGAAIRAQTRALEALQKAANAAEAAAERMAQMAGPGAMQPGAAGSGLDPLGRPGTGFGQGAVELPDQSEVRRIQAIRKILEERASDPSRSPEERGYYLRLLKRF